MRVSVVIPSYRRADSLQDCLDALARQETSPAEVIVVIRTDDEASRRVISAHPLSVRCVEVDRPGVIAAMNAGADASVGDVVALTDDDAQPHPDWLTRLRDTYLADPELAAVGGRDLVFHSQVLENGEEHDVGTVDRLGRLTGNHHLGAGPVRDVDVLKGVNLSVRGPLLRELRFDERLIGVGTEHHWEIALCLTMRSCGLRIAYDPTILVDHHPQPRVEGARQLEEPLHVRNATHNLTLALLEYLPAGRRAAYLIWSVAIGTRNSPGFAQSLRGLLRSGDPRLTVLRGSLTGRYMGVRTFARSRSARL